MLFFQLSSRMSSPHSSEYSPLPSQSATVHIELMIFSSIIGVSISSMAS